MVDLKWYEGEERRDIMKRRRKIIITKKTEKRRANKAKIEMEIGSVVA